MAGSISDFLENELLDHLIGAAAYTAPATIHFGLATAAISDSTTGSTVTEPSGNGYARKSETNNKTLWGAASSRSVALAAAVTFATASGGSWGTATHWFIADAPSGGNILAHGDLTVSKAVADGETVSFESGDITISIASGGMTDFLANEILDHVFGAAAYTAPATLYIALADTTVVDADTGSTISEPAGGSYARASVTNNKTNFSTASGGSLDNALEIAFAEATGSWGTVTDVVVTDASSNGNALLYGALDTSKAVSSGDTVSFAANGLAFSLS